MWALKASEDKAKEKERKPMGSWAFSIECAYDRGQGLPTVYSDGLEMLESRVASNWNYSYSECTFLVKYCEEQSPFIFVRIYVSFVVLMYTFAQKLRQFLCNNITNTLKFLNDIYNTLYKYRSIINIRIYYASSMNTFLIDDCKMCEILLNLFNCRKYQRI